MTAGRGVIHSEMPVVTSGDLHGAGMISLGCTRALVLFGFLEWGSGGRLRAPRCWWSQPCGEHRSSPPVPCMLPGCACNPTGLNKPCPARCSGVQASSCGSTCLPRTR